MTDRVTLPAEKTSPPLFQNCLNCLEEIFRKSVKVTRGWGGGGEGKGGLSQVPMDSLL